MTSETDQVTDTAARNHPKDQASDGWFGWSGFELKHAHTDLRPEDLDAEWLAELRKELDEVTATITRNKRMRTITAIFAKHGLLYLLQDSGFARSLKKGGKSRSEALTDLGIRLRNAFQELGPTFIKLGQVLVTRQEMIPDQITHELAKLLDAIPAMPFPYIATVIDSELADGLATFSSINYEKPLGSASLAQVYRVELKDGRSAAMKVIRPGVHETFQTDIFVIRLMARIVDKLLPEKWSVTLDLPSAVREYYASSLDELDMNEENMAMTHFRNLVRELKYETVDVPEAYIVTRKLMVMELIEGWSLKEFPVDFLTFEERLHRITDLAHAYVYMMMTGWFHADPHASNILLNKHNKKIYVIDWGMTGRLDAVQVEALIRTLLHVRLNQASDAIESLLNVAEPSKYTNLIQLKDQLRSLLIHYTSSTQASRYNWGALLINAMQIGIKNYCRVPTGLALFAKGFSATEGTARWLAPEVSYHELVETADIQIMRNFLSRRLDYRVNAALLGETTQLVTTLPRRLDAILRHLAWNDFRVKQEYTIAPDTMKTLRKSANRLALAMVAAPVVYLKMKKRIGS